MRCIGRISHENHAQRFRDYLLTRGIDARIDADDGAFAVWILDEDRLAAAREELASFERQPDAEQYLAAIDEARQRRKQQLDENLAARKLQIDLRRRWEAPLIRRVPVTIALIILSGMATAVTRFGADKEEFNRLRTAPISSEGMYILRPFLHEVREGQVWRLITPIFVHMGSFHLVFNMLGLFMLGSPIEARRGHWIYLALVLSIAAISNVVEHWWTGPGFGGMSGVDYGLLGYLWYKSNYSPEEGFELPQQVVLVMLAWLVICLTGLAGGIANAAHISGLAAGVVLAAAGSLLRRRSR